MDEVGLMSLASTGNTKQNVQLVAKALSQGKDQAQKNHSELARRMSNLANKHKTEVINGVKDVLADATKNMKCVSPYSRHLS